MKVKTKQKYIIRVVIVRNQIVGRTTASVDNLEFFAPLNVSVRIVKIIKNIKI